METTILFCVNLNGLWYFLEENNFSGTSLVHSAVEPAIFVSALGTSCSKMMKALES